MKIKIYKNGRTRSSLNWNKTLKADGFVIKLRDKGTLLGSCYVKDEFIWSLVVNPKYRGNNYGKVLLDTAEKIIKQNHFKCARLVPQDNEEKLRKYYSNLGYTGHSKNEPGYEEEDKEWWIMTKSF